MAQLTCKNLTLGYDNRAIQEDLNFSIDAGDYLCIVGENGSGKSTLMKTLLHLQPPISGSIELGDGLKKNEIGYLPQQTLVQRDFPASVREIVLSGCQSRCGLRPFYNKEEKMVAQKAMEKMMIQDLADQCYRELSGGQQQRVLLARALCAAQKILLLDKILLHLPAPPFHLSRMAAIRLLSFLLLSSSPSSSLSSIFCRISGDRWRLSMPPMATEIAPVSSETTTSTLSAVSLMPTAARWRVPRSRDRP